MSETEQQEPQTTFNPFEQVTTEGEAALAAVHRLYVEATNAIGWSIVEYVRAHPEVTGPHDPLDQHDADDDFWSGLSDRAEVLIRIITANETTILTIECSPTKMTARKELADAVKAGISNLFATLRNELGEKDEADV